jgi:hypothetical protein
MFTYIVGVNILNVFKILFTNRQEEPSGPITKYGPIQYKHLETSSSQLKQPCCKHFWHVKPTNP